MRSRATRSAWTAILLLGLAGCASARMDLPKGFLELEDRHDFQAVTADDARIWIREFSDPNEAPLEFWIGVLTHEFTKQRGYELVGQGTVTASLGTGSWFECAANVRGERIALLPEHRGAQLGRRVGRGGAAINREPGLQQAQEASLQRPDRGDAARAGVVELFDASARIAAGDRDRRIVERGFGLHS